MKIFVVMAGDDDALELCGGYAILEDAIRAAQLYDGRVQELEMEVFPPSVPRCIFFHVAMTPEGITRDFFPLAADRNRLAAEHYYIRDAEISFTVWAKSPLDAVLEAGRRLALLRDLNAMPVDGKIHPWPPVPGPGLTGAQIFEIINRPKTS